MRDMHLPRAGLSLLSQEVIVLHCVMGVRTESTKQLANFD